MHKGVEKTDEKLTEQTVVLKKKNIEGKIKIQEKRYTVLLANSSEGEV